MCYQWMIAINMMLTYTYTHGVMLTVYIHEHAHFSDERTFMISLRSHSPVRFCAAPSALHISMLCSIMFSVLT